MMYNGPRRSRGRAAVAAVVMAAAIVSCTDLVRAPLAPQDALAKGGGGTGVPSVASASPSYGYQGDVARQVSVTGSGFAAGAVAAWERNGAPDLKVTVLSTQFVSSTQLTATITIAADADIALYDVSVENPDRKKGIGTSLFEITTAEVLGTLGRSSYVTDMNDAGAIAGYCTGNAGCTGAFVYEDGPGMVALGSGQAWGTDPLGSMVLGRDGSLRAMAWVKQPGGSYVAELLPSPGGVVSNASSGARDGTGSLIVGGWDQIKLSKNNTPNRPVVWTRVGNAWSAPVFYAHPGTASSITDLNGSGQAVGRWDGQYGVAWENATTYTTLDGIPLSINDAGNVVVGERNGLPVFWVRNATTLAWIGTGVALPSISGTSCGPYALTAEDVNDFGIIVGTSCNGSCRQATVWRLDMSGATPVLVGGAQGLPGLGAAGSDKSGAVAVSRNAPYIVAGGAAPNGQNLVVRWVLP